MTADIDNAPTYWVFGYGSLIWRPGFSFVSAHQALLRGAHRQLCIYSYHYRGTKERPGLVFGLVRGGSCHGMAFEVAEADWPEVHEYLRARELISDVYRETSRAVRLADGRDVRALAYVVDEAHEQYAGALDVAAQLELVRDASGAMGPNTDYVLNTAWHLREMGIEDRRLKELTALLS